MYQEVDLYESILQSWSQALLYAAHRQVTVFFQKVISFSTQLFHLNKSYNQKI